MILLCGIVVISQTLRKSICRSIVWQTCLANCVVDDHLAQAHCYFQSEEESDGVVLPKASYGDYCAGAIFGFIPTPAYRNNILSHWMRDVSLNLETESLVVEECVVGPDEDLLIFCLTKRESRGIYSMLLLSSGSRLFWLSVVGWRSSVSLSIFFGC